MISFQIQNLSSLKISAVYSCTRLLAPFGAHSLAIRWPLLDVNEVLDKGTGGLRGVCCQLGRWIFSSFQSFSQHGFLKKGNMSREDSG